MRGVRAPLYTQELLQSWVLSSGTTVSCRVSELWAAGGRHRDGETQQGHRAQTKAQEARATRREVVKCPREIETQRRDPRMWAVHPEQGGKGLSDLGAGSEEE